MDRLNKFRAFLFDVGDNSEQEDEDIEQHGAGRRRNPVPADADVIPPPAVSAQPPRDQLPEHIVQPAEGVNPARGLEAGEEMQQAVNDARQQYVLVCTEGGVCLHLVKVAGKASKKNKFHLTGNGSHQL